MFDNFLGNLLINLIATAAVAALGYCFRMFIENRNRLKLLGCSLLNRGGCIRISAAYLFRIKVNEKYLLVRGRNISQYQPVGGVYKYFKSSAETRNKLGIQRDCRIGKSDAEDDLRIMVPRKKLLEFLEWFDGGTGREVSVWREFNEELVSTGALGETFSPSAFNPEFIKHAPRQVKYDSHFETDQLLLHDVYEFHVDDLAAVALSDFVATDDSHQFVLVDADDINRGHVLIEGVSWSIALTAKQVL